MVAGKGGKHMDQKKIGQFLQTLRKEKELTQEQLAEKFNVSNRTVSRWETGGSLS
jgi:transcriptional regulator with XRE-family HTH domain